MNDTLLSRHEFRERALERDDGECLVPWCDRDADEVHHIIERSLWADGGYYLRNAAPVCNPHHQYAEDDYIPPQAFWRWLDVDPITPEEYGTHISKWGASFDTPPWQEHREYPKYPSSRHLLPVYWHSAVGTAEERTDRDDTGHTTVEPFLDIPLVATVKMDGGNAMLVADDEEPVRARNGRYADHVSFDRLKREYWDRDVYSVLPGHLQVFGENLYAKHSIHYGCDCETPCDDVGPAVDDVFEVFGIYDTRYDIWLGWPEVEEWADRIGFPTVPIMRETIDDASGGPFEREDEFCTGIEDLARRVISEGHEGLVVRSRLPFHYGQFPERLGKYVRVGHVTDGETHWSKRDVVPNVIDEA